MSQRYPIVALVALMTLGPIATIVKAESNAETISETTREQAKKQFEDKLTELKESRTKLRQEHRADIEKMTELKAEKLTELAAKKQERLTELAQERADLKNETETKITEAIKQQRLVQIKRHAAALTGRLNAATARSLALASKIQTRLDQLTDETLKNTLSSQLAELTITEQKLSDQVAAAQTALTAIAGSAEPAAAATTARDLVTTAVTTFKSLITAYGKITSQLPS